MPRAAVLCLVFMVAAGPSLPMLCKAWCATQVAETGCHHGNHGGTTRVEKNNSCQDQVLVATIPKEDTRRRVAPDDMTVWAAPRSTLRAHLSDLHPPDRPRLERSDARSTVLAPLRI